MHRIASYIVDLYMYRYYYYFAFVKLYIPL